MYTKLRATRAVMIGTAALAVSTATTDALAVERFVRCEGTGTDHCFHSCDTAKKDAGIGSFAVAACNKQSGYLATWTHASLFSVANAEAVQRVTFNVGSPSPRYITAKARIIKTGGVMQQGTAAFGGTELVWSLDAAQPYKQRYTEDLDSWFGLNRAIGIAKDLALAVAGELVPGAEEAFAAIAAIDSVFNSFVSFLQMSQATELVVEKRFYVQPGYHTLDVGVRSTTSVVCEWWELCLSGSSADAIVQVAIDEIVVWGAGMLEAPVVEGPSEGCPFGIYTFTVHHDSCPFNSSIAYKFDWGNGTDSGWSECVPCASSVSRSAGWGTMGTYNVSVTARNCDDGTTTAAPVVHPVNIDSWPPSPYPIVYVEPGGCCVYGTADMHIRWTSVEDADTYYLYRNDGSGESLVYDGPATSYADAVPCQITTPGAVNYWVLAQNGCGTTDSRRSAGDVYAVGHYKTPPKGSPSVAAASSGSCDVRLTWDAVRNTGPFPETVSDVVNAATEYVIYRHTENNRAAATEIGRTDCTQCTTYHDAPPAANTEYFYWIESVNECGPQRDPLMAPVSGSRMSDQAVPPSNVSATDDNCQRVEVDWDDVPNMTYKVFRETDEERVEVTDTQPLRDYDAIPGVPYRYVVQGCVWSCQAGECPETSVPGMRPEANPSPPENMTASQGTECGQITISWDPIPMDTPSTMYTLKRDGMWLYQGPDTSYVDDDVNLQDGHIYTYQVYATNCTGVPDNGVPAEVSGWMTPGSSPTAPQNVTASDAASCDWVRIDWDPVYGATHYSVKRRVGTDVVEFPNITGSRYYDETAESAVEYEYSVIAHTNCTPSPESDTDTGHTRNLLLTAPTNFRADTDGRCDRIRLDWDAVPDAAHYRLYRSVNALPGVVATAVLTAPYYEDRIADCDTAYNYWVFATNRCGQSPAAEIVGAQLDPDEDCDRTCDVDDNCPSIYNPTQGDCDADGTGDACEVNPANQDCDHNGVCNGDELDCQGNGIADVCEIDCNYNGVPDDCDIYCFDAGCSSCVYPSDVSGSVRACRGVFDGTCTDGGGAQVGTVTGLADATGQITVSFDLDPDQYTAAAAARQDGTLDWTLPMDTTVTGTFDLGLCELNGTIVHSGQTLSWHAGRSQCDPDVDANGVIDACECAVLDAPVAALEQPGSRYLSFQLPSTPQVDYAIRVRIIDLDGFPPSPTDLLWVGPPEVFPEEDSSDPERTFAAAPLQCAAYYGNWSLFDGTVARVYGAEIGPGSQYEVQIIGQDCPSELEANYSSPLTLFTGKYGDAVPLYDGSGTPQPDFQDIAATVSKFMGEPGSPEKYLVQLQPNVVFPSRPVDFRDIAAAVEAFVGSAFATFGYITGPCQCPSDVTCGAVHCLSDSSCGDGFCVDNHCLDACGRCTP